jgi:hypothetical protein
MQKVRGSLDAVISQKRNDFRRGLLLTHDGGYDLLLIFGRAVRIRAMRKLLDLSPTVRRNYN